MRYGEGRANGRAALGHVCAIGTVVGWVWRVEVVVWFVPSTLDLGDRAWRDEMGWDGWGWMEFVLRTTTRRRRRGGCFYFMTLHKVLMDWIINE